MADLETPRPGVQKALDDLSYFLTGTHNHDDFYTIRVELLRLTRENAELRRAWGDTLLTGTGILKVERIDPAAVMLPVEPRPRNETPVPKSEWEALTERAEKAEAELAALKARIAGSCRADGQRVFDLLGLPIEYDGTLALVKVEE